LELTHEFTVPAGIDETWNAFNDIESVAACFPGATVTSVEGDTFQGSCKVKLGPIALVYNGSGTFVEKDESAHRMVIDAKGKDKRGNGTAGAHVTATLSEVGTGTRVEVVTDLAITGKPAQFGRGVMQDVSDKLLGQFTDCLEQKVGSGGTPAAPEAATEAEATDAVQAEVLESATATSGEAAEPVDNVRRMEPPTAATAPRTPAPDDALDLGATVLPVLLKSYWRQALGVLVVLLVLRRLLRRG
jgi:uncharacterized protein